MSTRCPAVVADKESGAVVETVTGAVTVMLPAVEVAEKPFRSGLLYWTAPPSVINPFAVIVSPAPALTVSVPADVVVMVLLPEFIRKAPVLL